MGACLGRVAPNLDVLTPLTTARRSFSLRYALLCLSNDGTSIRLYHFDPKFINALLSTAKVALANHFWLSQKAVVLNLKGTGQRVETVFVVMCAVLELPLRAAGHFWHQGQACLLLERMWHPVTRSGSRVRTQGVLLCCGDAEPADGKPSAQLFLHTRSPTAVTSLERSIYQKYPLGLETRRQLSPTTTQYTLCGSPEDPTKIEHRDCAVAIIDFTRKLHIDGVQLVAALGPYLLYLPESLPSGRRHNFLRCLLEPRAQAIDFVDLKKPQAEKLRGYISDNYEATLEYSSDYASLTSADGEIARLAMQAISEVSRICLIPGISSSLGLFLNSNASKRKRVDLFGLWIRQQKVELLDAPSWAVITVASTCRQNLGICRSKRVSSWRYVIEATLPLGDAVWKNLFGLLAHDLHRVGCALHTALDVQGPLLVFHVPKMDAGATFK